MFKRIVDAANKILSFGARSLIHLYRLLLSPILPPSCRFHPSCSEYALEAFKTHGVFRGFKLAIFRLARCHPWGGNGFDPVPPQKKS